METSSSPQMPNCVCNKKIDGKVVPLSFFGYQMNDDVGLLCCVMGLRKKAMLNKLTIEAKLVGNFVCGNLVEKNWAVHNSALKDQKRRMQASNFLAPASWNKEYPVVSDAEKNLRMFINSPEGAFSSSLLASSSTRL